MPRLLVLAGLAALALMTSRVGPAQAQIMDPAAHNLVRLEPLVLGVDNDSTKMAPTEYRLKVGQGYRWKIKATDLTEYAFIAPQFIRNIWIRKVEVGDVEIKAVTLDELEFEKGGEAELFFVAVRPGTYEFGSKGLMERGMVGKIIVEASDLASAHDDKKAKDDDKDG